ncbi:LysR family transcriptional regulator [Zavarzinia compransoris]|uniref:LysR substrate-binding domain-containing protein n=1 Tax=Zavarzinia marina TaxID=2911065 RepID=UPI001F3195A1|nr:LysR family transcriptional regulator [Zavarzinia marina]MCF4164496.1 LysR family transcriptional regulator [Zavarzinia marina]
MDRIRQMQIFIQVMESGSFTRAAAALNLPRSTVSTEVQALEDRLQVQLLQRTTRRVMPTDDGLRFFSSARDIVDAVEVSEHMFGKGPMRIRGRLRIDMPSRIGRRIVIPALPDFIAAHPGIELTLSMTDRLVDMIAEGVDFVIRVGALENSDLVCSRLGDVELINCASPAYLAARGTPATPDDLPSHDLVNYAARLPAGDAAWEHVEDGTPRTLTMRSAITVDNAEAYIAAARAGLGIIQIPAFDVRDLLDTGALIEIMPDFRPPPMQLSLLYVRRRHLPPRIRLFQTWIRDVLQAHDVVR